MSELQRTESEIKLQTCTIIFYYCNTICCNFHYISLLLLAEPVCAMAEDGDVGAGAGDPCGQHLHRLGPLHYPHKHPHIHE